MVRHHKKNKLFVWQPLVKQKFAGLLGFSKNTFFQKMTVFKREKTSLEKYKSDQKFKLSKKTIKIELLEMILRPRHQKSIYSSMKTYKQIVCLKMNKLGFHRRKSCSA